MSKYKFDETEQDILKVAKYNQDLSNNLLEETKQLKNELSANNDKNEEFLQNIEKKLGIQSQNIEYKLPAIILSKSTIPDWEQLRNDAKSNIIGDVDYEDLLTTEEFANAYRHLNEIDALFEKKTGLKKVDWLFLVTAIALQCTRQYVINPFIKKHRAKASQNDENGRKGNSEPGWYYVETEKILTNKAPFDTTAYNSDNATIQGFLKGGDHRMMTLGHDPLLGWFFGTANILTNTMTRKDFVSAHIKHKLTKRAPISGENVIHSLADTLKILTACKERLFEEGLDGKLAVGSAIIREGIHLSSDIYTKRSLPIPVISSTNPEFAKELAKYGIDTASVGTEMGLSLLINTFISMVHRLFYDKSIDDTKLYEVRTRKILLYSNTIATTSNVIAAYITKKPEILDVGGLLVTIMRLFSDVRFICRVKQDFIQSALDIHFNGIVDELERMYKFDTV